MRNKERIACEGCGAPQRVPVVIVDWVAGKYYCGDCEPPEGHPQHPDNDARPP